ncbi:hypothetical protein K438DRAFT_1170845 [Mycena galopus ATCC 62051]|nr:hypothetical protein K438DRAFT_1170845 [Mycena galopus ATCC 62051]
MFLDRCLSEIHSTCQHHTECRVANRVPVHGDHSFHGFPQPHPRTSRRNAIHAFSSTSATTKVPGVDVRVKKRKHSLQVQVQVTTVTVGPSEDGLGEGSDRRSAASTAGYTPSPTAPCSPPLPFLSLRPKKSRLIRPTLTPPCITPTAEWAEPSRRRPVAPAVDLDEVMVRPCDDFGSAALRPLGKGKGKAPAIDLGGDCDSDDDISEATTKLRVSSRTHSGAQLEEVEKAPRPSFDEERYDMDDAYPPAPLVDSRPHGISSAVGYDHLPPGIRESDEPLECGL